MDSNGLWNVPDNGWRKRWHPRDICEEQLCRRASQQKVRSSECDSRTCTDRIQSLTTPAADHVLLSRQPATLYTHVGNEQRQNTVQTHTHTATATGNSPGLLGRSDGLVHKEWTLSLRFNGHIPGEPWSAGVYWSKGWWRWWLQLDYWSYKSCKAPVKSSPPTNQHPVFLYRPDALSVAQPTMSKHWRENVTFHGLA